jgi:hypothetical protein
MLVLRVAMAQVVLMELVAAAEVREVRVLPLRLTLQILRAVLAVLARQVVLRVRLLLMRVVVVVVDLLLAAQVVRVVAVRGQVGRL